MDWNKIDVIIHLAGKAYDTENTTEEQTYFDINVGLTKKIFDHFLKSNSIKFIYFSSVKAIADSVKGEYLTEEAESNPGTAYGKSKLEAEKVIWERLNGWERKSEGAKNVRKGEKEKERNGEREKRRGSKMRKGEGAKRRGSEKEHGRQGDNEKKVYILRPSMIHGRVIKATLTYYSN